MDIFEGKHAVVTGGGTGIGAAIATSLAQLGAQVTVAGRRLEPLETLAQTHDNIHAVQADVTDSDSTRDLFDAAAKARGPANIIIANAGAANSDSFKRLTSQAWSDMLTINMTGTFNTFQAGLSHVGKGSWARLIAIASTAGLKGYGYASAYCAAKHGVVGLTRALADEYAGTGTTANSVCPGFTETPLLDRAVDNIKSKTGMSDGDARKALASDNPMKRLITPDEVAQTVIWLCGPGSDVITGQSISVSGGATT